MYVGMPIGNVAFGLNDVERIRAEQFMASRRIAEEDHAATGQQFAFVFVPTTIGMLITIRDQVSGDEEKITDLDKF